MNGKILFIRPKLYLADDGQYRESRYFTPWGKPNYCGEYYLPPAIQKLQGAIKVPFGDAIVSTPDSAFAAETCEEIFTPSSPHVALGLDGVEVFTNSSGSHHQLRKLDKRLDLIINATAKSGGIYVYCNQRGGDGDILYYDGSSLISMNGKVVAQASQFSLNDVEVITATLDLEEVRSYRFAPSRGMQANQATPYKRIETDFHLSQIEEDDFSFKPTSPIKVRYHLPEEEISLGPACFLWDYLRRSRQAGYIVPLSGGLDSCSTSVIVFSMCRMVYQAIQEGNEQVIEDLGRIVGPHKGIGPNWTPSSPQDICHLLFHTVYLGMETQSSKETRQRAIDLSKDIGAYHIDTNIDDIYQGHLSALDKTLGFTPKFKTSGGSVSESLSLQNLQARSRMVHTYLYAQNLAQYRGREGGGGLLVLGSSNVDESLRGYLTKYDCSSADVNPIGSVSKVDLKKFLAWAQTAYSLPILEDFLTATPTAELEPITDSYVQSDEADMGITYAHLSVLGRLRKESRRGPFSIFKHLVDEWKGDMPIRDIATLVKNFHHWYQINRHKQRVLTPGVHLENYSVEDHRHDLRQLLYPPFYQSLAAKAIDALVEKMEAGEKGVAADEDSDVD